MPAYLSRLGLAAAPAPDERGLSRLLTAHRQAIAFENLDILLGRGIAIDSASAYDKLVTRQRGGYCFEQNQLFADMLAALGLPTRMLLARVRLGQPDDAVTPRTHVLLLARLDSEPVVLDAGFGGTLIPLLPLREGVELATPDGVHHRLVRTGERGSLSGEWLLQRAGPRGATADRAFDHDSWQAQYSFDLGEVDAVDLAQANHWTSTHPASRFTGAQIVSMVRPGGFASLVENTFKSGGEGLEEEREVTSPADYHALLTGLFRLRLDLDEVTALPLFAG